MDNKSSISYLIDYVYFCDKSHDYYSKCDEFYAIDKLIISCSKCVEKMCGFCKENHEDLCSCNIITDDNVE